MENANYAVEAIRSWYEAHSLLLNKYCTSCVFKESGHGSASVRLETGRHLIDLTAWNHASCLDIQILDISSEESSFPTTGDCNSREIFEGHLAKFTKWFESVYQENA